MPIETGGRAPYAPPSAVIEIIKRYRDSGLVTPFTGDVLMRAGVSESLAPRTLQALQLLDLIEESGEPTSQLEAIRLAPSDEYRNTLADALRVSYSEVFQFVEPAQDGIQRIEDAFRDYRPAGQRQRMVTLFLGLCEEAGIVDEMPSRSKPSAKKKSSPKSRASGKPKPKKSLAFETDNSLPPALAGLMAQIPSSSHGWTQERRNSFVETFGAVLDFCVPIIEEYSEEEAT